MLSLLHNRVCAVIVSYNPPDALLDSLAAIRPQVTHLVLVDNGSAFDSVQMLEIARSTLNCEVIRNGSNIGIAKALNRGISYARSRGSQHVLFFDQDSKVANSDYVASLLEAYGRSSGSIPIAMVAPCYVDRISGTHLPIARRRDGSPISTMTSGTLVPIKTFAALGQYDERLFIDYVDIEFCLRCHQSRYVILEAPQAVLLHTLGRPTRHRLFGKSFVTTNHSASRRYYITRNRLLTMLRYWRDWQWLSYELKLSLSELVKVVFVEENTKDKLSCATRGIADALRNRTGRRLSI